MNRIVPRDEREWLVDLAADRLAFLVLSYGVLIAVAYRSLALGLASWDLLGLVVIAGLTGAAYRARHGVVTGRWAAMLLVTAIIAAAVAIALATAGR